MTTIKFYKKRIRWYYQWQNEEYWIDMPDFFNALTNLLGKEDEVEISFGEFVHRKSLFIWSDGASINYSDALLALSRILNVSLPLYVPPRKVLAFLRMWEPYEIINIG